MKSRTTNNTSTDTSTSLLITREWAMPSPNTFSIPPIERLLKRVLAGRRCVVDPFARDSTIAHLTNDINDATNSTFHMDAVEFLREIKHDGMTVDAVLIDPPYSPRQISECYKQAGRTVGMTETQNARLYKNVKDAANELLTAGGLVVCCGWNSGGMGKTRGYEMREILMVAHGVAHNDTIVTVEIKR